MTDPGPVVVLGGSGFVGGHVAAAFAGAGRRVVAVSRGPVPERPGVTWAPMDLAAGTGQLTALLARERPDVVVNAVGAVWTASERAMLDANATLTAQLVAAVAALPERPRFLHVGTVYEYAPTPVGGRIDASTPQFPRGVYGWTKLLGTSSVLQATAAGRLDGAVLRMATAIGPGVPRGSLLGGVAERLLRIRAAGGPGTLTFGALLGDADFVDVRDAAAAVVAAATRPVTGEIVNIGAGRAVRVRRVVEMLVDVSGLDVAIEETDRVRTFRRRYSGTDWLQVDIEAAARLLDWTPRIPLTDSLQALWDDRTTATRRTTADRTAPEPTTSAPQPHATAPAAESAGAVRVRQAARGARSPR